MWSSYEKLLLLERQHELKYRSSLKITMMIRDGKKIQIVGENHSIGDSNGETPPSNFKIKLTEQSIEPPNQGSSLFPVKSVLRDIQTQSIIPSTNDGAIPCDIRPACYPRDVAVLTFCNATIELNAYEVYSVLEYMNERTACFLNPPNIVTSHFESLMTKLNTADAVIMKQLLTNLLEDIKACISATESIKIASEGNQEKNYIDYTATVVKNIRKACEALKTDNLRSFMQCKEESNKPHEYFHEFMFSGADNYECFKQFLELLFFEIPQFLTDICFVMTALIQESNCSVYCGQLHVPNITSMLKQLHFKDESD